MTTPTIREALALLEHAASFAALRDNKGHEADRLRRALIVARAALAADVPAESAQWRPCLNCSVDSTGKTTHCIGCPNDPEVFRAPAEQTAAVEVVPVAWLLTGGRMFPDRATVRLADAEEGVRNRGDGTRMAPLYAAPAQPAPPDTATDFQLEQLFDAVHEHGIFGREFREHARSILATPAPIVTADSLGASANRRAARLGFAVPPLAATPASPEAVQPVVPPVTDVMVAAYLQANDAYWREVDALPRDITKAWRQGTPKEATHASLEAALAVAPASAPPEMTTAEQERTAFEAWGRTAGVNLNTLSDPAYPSGTYADSRVHAAWSGWFARSAGLTARDRQWLGGTK